MNVWDDPDFVEHWNETYGLDMARAPIRAQFVFKWIEESIGTFQGKRLLDLGCGNGNLIKFFEEKPYTEWVGVDAGEAVLSSARNSVLDERINFVYADVTQQFPYTKTGYGFDFVTSVFVLEEIPSNFLGAYFNVMASLLKHQGQALLFTNHPVNALVEDMNAVTKGVGNQKFDGLEGYFDQTPSTYSLSVMNMQKGVVDKADYHHKTLSTIMNEISKSGLVLKSMIEVPRNVITLDNYKSHTPSMGDVPRFLGLQLSK